MNRDGGESELLSPAEARLVALLELLRLEAPRAEDSLTERVMRTARWQYALRGTLRLLSEIVAALTEGLALVFGLREQRLPESPE